MWRWSHRHEGGGHHQPMDGRLEPQRLQEAGRSLPWSPCRDCGPAHTLTSAFRPPGLCLHTFLLSQDTTSVSHWYISHRKLMKRTQGRSLRWRLETGGCDYEKES